MEKKKWSPDLFTVVSLAAFKQHLSKYGIILQHAVVIIRRAIFLLKALVLKILTATSVNKFLAR